MHATQKDVWKPDKITGVIVTKLLNWSNKLDQFGTYESHQKLFTDGGGSSYPKLEPYTIFTYGSLFHEMS